MITNAKAFRVAMLLRSDKERVQQIVGTLYLNLIFDYFRVDTLEDLRETYLQIRDRYDGILTSGALSDRFIACYSGKTAIPHRCFNVSVENYYRHILMQTMRDPGLHLGQIRLDVMEREHNLADIIEKDQLGMLIQDEHARLSHMEPERVIEYERELVARHEQILQNAEWKMVLTHSVAAREVLERQNAPYLYVPLTTEEIFSTVEALRRDMEMQELRDSQVASIFLDAGDDCKPEALSLLADALHVFCEQRKDVPLLFGRSGNHFEALTDAQTISALTGGTVYCELTGFLQGRTGIEVAVGYGIGNTMKGARDNAMAAARYARKNTSDLPQAFLIGSDGQVAVLQARVRQEVPPGSNKRKGGEIIFGAAVTEIARKAHLSSRTVLRLLTALREGRRRDADSEWIRRELDVSLRQANKILANLERAGYAHISGKQQMGGRGRPSNVYLFHFDISD